MNSAVTLAMFETMKATFPQAVVSVAVLVDANTTVTTYGLRSNEMVMRKVERGGLADNVDVGIWVLASLFDDVAALRGRTVTVGNGDDAVTMRITGTQKHALGGLVKLIIGEYDRVTQ